VRRAAERVGVGGFEIGYVTDDCLEHRVSPSQAWATPFESCSPIRRFTSHQGQRHLSCGGRPRPAGTSASSRGWNAITVDGYKLGAWVKEQRVKHADGTLVADREQRLQEVPGWTWDPFADMWEEGFSRPRQYVERHGDERVPSSYTVVGYRLVLQP
jgi:hypothetical protein